MAQVNDLPTISLMDLRNMARRAKYNIDYIFLHWTAGNYGQYFDDYHLLVDADGSIKASTDDLTKLLSHTWHRNSNAVGIAMCCCVDADTEKSKTGDFGSQPPTPAMIDGMAKVVAVLCEELDLAVNFNNVKTHCEIALIDGYGPYSGDPETRWDLWYLPNTPGDGEIMDGGDVIRGKAIWWQNNGC